ncbi:hypothetical protein [Planomicrobium sp. CPCC 101110]|uniref:hypothetical protein n=1 Tax=Planomicrobium sp. CPCC 101110 TaxID=2599619 RepID=UPI0011B37F64|nr:hypothetical protein [Planomicrobium sp. CPCC 101110]TWT25954.1 hypothetical protein FQV30_09185 [Planomicrobium sp. CPCC 101110]
MLRNFLSFMSVFFFLVTIVPLGLASIHWVNAPMNLLMSFNVYFPCLIGAAGILFALTGPKGDLKLYLILANSLSLGLYLIKIFIISVTA